MKSRTRDSAKEPYKRDLYIFKKALHISRSALPKSPTYPQTGPSKKAWKSTKKMLLKSGTRDSARQLNKRDINVHKRALQFHSMRLT